MLSVTKFYSSSDRSWANALQNVSHISTNQIDCVTKVHVQVHDES